MKAENYEKEKKEVEGKMINITTYKIGERYYCHIDNVSPGATIVPNRGSLTGGGPGSCPPESHGPTSDLLARSAGLRPARCMFHVPDHTSAVRVTSVTSGRQLNRMGAVTPRPTDVYSHISPTR